MKAAIFIERLQTVVKKLERSQDKEIIHFSLGQPADEQVIKEIQQRYFNGRENELLNLYRQCNGIQLIWTYMGDKVKSVKVDPLMFKNNNVRYPGVVNFLPLEKLFNPAQWKETTWFEDDSLKQVTFAGEELTNKKIKQSLFPVDFFSIDMSVACYCGLKDSYLLLLQDYHIDYTGSILTFPEAYFEFIILTEGLVKARYQAFNQLNGYRLTPLQTTELLGRIKNN